MALCVKRISFNVPMVTKTKQCYYSKSDWEPKSDHFWCFWGKPLEEWPLVGSKIIPVILWTIFLTAFLLRNLNRRDFRHNPWPSPRQSSWPWKEPVEEDFWHRWSWRSSFQSSRWTCGWQSISKCLWKTSLSPVWIVASRTSSTRPRRWPSRWLLIRRPSAAAWLDLKEP